MSYDEAVSVTAPAGWRALVVPRPESTTVALQWVVDAGSRHDGDQPGLARLTAELTFGAVAPPTHPDLMAPLEALGAEGHSTTTREYASFQAIVAAPQRATLWTLLPALARPPLLTDAALERARAMIAQERRERTSPSGLLGDLLVAALWGDTPFARPPDADARSLDALTADHVAAFHAAHYDPTHVVLAVAGACEAADVGSALASLPAGPSPTAAAALPRPAFQGAGAYHYDIPIDVTHLAVAVPVPGMGHQDRPALRLLDYILGRGGSSRLYRELRESRGLAYNCSSIFMPYAHVGVFAAQARCAPERGSEVAALLRAALLELAARAPGAGELSAAQRRYAGALYRSFETNATLVSILSLETLLDEWEPFDHAVARVAAVTPADLAAVTARYFDPSQLVQVSVGPIDPRASDMAPAAVP